MPPDGEIIPPEHLSERARYFWDRHAPILLEMGLLTVADVDMLATLCSTEAVYWDAMEASGGDFEGSAWKAASDAGKRLKSLMVEFGMTPSARTRVKSSPKPAEKSSLEKLRDRRNA